MKPGDQETAIQFCQRLIQHFREKADHNKRETLTCFVVVIGTTLMTPLFVTLGTGLWLGKVVPSVLSLLAAACTAWIQQRKPQQLWTLYRTAQRELEDQHVRFQFAIGEYSESADLNRLLAQRVADISLRVHRQWVPLVPTVEKLEELHSSAHAAGAEKQKAAE